MIKFKDFLRGMPVISEKLHPSVVAALDDTSVSPNDKINNVTKTIHRLLDRGEHPGIDAEQHRGSSRAVHFHTEPMQVTLDGKPANVPAVTKIAFPGQLDKFNHSGKLLGEHQNAIESDPDNTKFGIIRKKKGGGEDEYETNTKTGVLAPHLGTNNKDQYLHQGKVKPLEDFYDDPIPNLTRTKSFPNGISHGDIQTALMKHYQEAHGKSYVLYPEEEKRISKVQNHPLVKKMQNFVAQSGNHPGDLSTGNMGIWKHPHTGEQHVVIQDYGFGHEVPKLYQQARINEMNGANHHDYDEDEEDHRSTSSDPSYRTPTPEPSTSGGPTTDPRWPKFARTATPPREPYNSNQLSLGLSKHPLGNVESMFKQSRWKEIFGTKK